MENKTTLAARHLLPSLLYLDLLVAKSRLKTDDSLCAGSLSESLESFG
jgi:hypothetical protein